MMKALIVFPSLFFASSIALAGSLINKDKVKHEYELKCGSTTHTSIGSNTTQSSGAKKGCKIKLKSTGQEFAVDQDKDVVIKDSKIAWR